MSKRCVGDSRIVEQYPYDSVAISRKRARAIAKVLCLGDKVCVIEWKRGRTAHAQVGCATKWDGGRIYTIEIRHWTLATLLHEIAHVNVMERFGAERWWYHDARFKREQERLYNVYQALASIGGWFH